MKLLYLTLFKIAVLTTECSGLRRVGIFNQKQNIHRGGFETGSSCIGDNGIQGTCLSRLSCSKQRGTSVGLCGLFGTCCALSTCDMQTNLKMAIFSNPQLSNDGIDCSYNVDINNANVCQMRIDFEMFSLAPPTTTIDSSTLIGPGYECQDDEFVITGYLPGDNVPALCGENTGQHVYVRVNASMNVRSIKMTLKIVDRNNRPSLQQALWRFRVTQLECFNMPRKFKEIDVWNALPDFKLTASSDEYLLAPPGCLQYYPDRTGSLESFNYNRGVGPYLGSLFYSMCFSRRSNICGIRFTVNTFELSFVNTVTDVDSQCELATTGIVNGDYLFFPEAQTALNIRAAKWCGTSLQNQIIAVTPPGPLYIDFKSDDVVTSGRNEYGFRLNYNSINNCN